MVGSGTSTASTTYLHPDHLGGTNVATDEDGEVAQTLDYYPYGSQRIATGSFAEQRRFIGEEYDGDTEFSYLNARYYEGSSGQFMSQDPAVRMFDGKDKQLLLDPQQLNSYSYARNNPLILLDATGEKVILPQVLYLQEDNIFIIMSPQIPEAGFRNWSFTLGAGPQVPILIGFGRLQTRIGFDSSNKDFENGLADATSYIQLDPEEAQSEDALILGLYRGHVAVSKSDARYWFLGNKPGQNNANSNNYARTLAQYGGVLGQFESFMSQVNAPGSKSSVPLGSASEYGVGNSQGNFIGTYNFGPGIGAYNFGTQSWESSKSK